MADEMEGKVSLDVSGFKAGVAALVREVKVVDSGYQALTAGMRDAGNTSDGLNAKINQLSERIFQNNKILEAQQAQYDKVVAVKGKDSRMAQDLAIAINKTTEAINRDRLALENSREKLNSLGDETSDVALKTNKLGDEEKQTEKKTHDMSNAMNTAKAVAGHLGTAISGAAHLAATAAAGIGKAAIGIGSTVAKGMVAGVKAIGAMGAAAGAAAAGIYKVAGSSAQAADSIATDAAKYGITTKKLQELSYASKFVDVDVATMGGSFAKLTKAMGQAETKAGKDAKKAFKELGVSIRDDVTGEMRDAEDVWADAINKLGGIKNETDRNLLSQKLFGKSYQELNPLIAAGGDALKKYMDEAHKVGAVMDDLTLKKLNVLQDALDSSKSSFDGLKNIIGAAVAPQVTALSGIFQDLVITIKGAVETGNWSSVGATLSGGLKKIIEMATSFVPGILQVLTSVIPGIVSAVVASIPALLPTLAGAVLVLLSAVTQIVSDNGQSLISAGIDAIVMLANGFLAAAPQLIGAAMSLLETVAARLPQIVPLFLAAAQTLVDAIATGVTTYLPTIINAGIKLFTGLVTSVISALPTILPTVVSGALTLVNALIGLIASQGPRLVTIAIQAAGKLVMGLLQAVPQLTTAAVGIITALVQGLTSQLPELIPVALSAVMALIQGIFSLLPMILDAAVQIVVALVQGIAAQLPTLIPAAVQCVITLVETLIKNLPMIIDAAILILLALVDGIVSALPKLLSAAPKIVVSIVNGIINAIPKLLDAALSIITALIEFLPEYIPMLIEATPQIITAIVTGLISAVGKVWEFIPKLFSELWDAVASIDWLQLGKSILDGLIEGLVKFGGGVWEALKGIVTSAVDSFKAFFGIASPSKYMRDQIGINLGSGIAEGLRGSGGLVGKAMAGLHSMLDVGSLSMSLNPAFAGVGAAGGSSSYRGGDNYYFQTAIPMSINGGSQQSVLNLSDAEALWLGRKVQSVMGTLEKGRTGE